MNAISSFQKHHWRTPPICEERTPFSFIVSPFRKLRTKCCLCKFLEMEAHFLFGLAKDGSSIATVYASACSEPLHQSTDVMEVRTRPFQRAGCISYLIPQLHTSHSCTSSTTSLIEKGAQLFIKWNEGDFLNFVNIN